MIKVLNSIGEKMADKKQAMLAQLKNNPEEFLKSMEKFINDQSKTQFKLDPSLQAKAFQDLLEMKEVSKLGIAAGEQASTEEDKKKS